MAGFVDLLTDERCAEFCATLYERLVIVNELVAAKETNPVYRFHQRLDSREADERIFRHRLNNPIDTEALAKIGIIIPASDRKDKLSPRDEDRSKAKVRGGRGAVAYAEALALCERVVSIGEPELVMGLNKLKVSQSTLERARKKKDKEFQTIVCAFLFRGRLYCGVAFGKTRKGAQFWSVFGRKGKTDRERMLAMTKSRYCFSVDVC